MNNHFWLARRVTGQRYIEFKYLAQWYVDNVRGREILAAENTAFLKFYAPQYKNKFCSLNQIKGDNLTDYVQSCYEQNITYIAWNYDRKTKPDDLLFKMLGIKDFDMAKKPQSTGPFIFVDQLPVRRGPIMNIFRLRKPQD